MSNDDNQLWPCSLHSCIMLEILCACVCGCGTCSVGLLLSSRRWLASSSSQPMDSNANRRISNITICPIWAMGHWLTFCPIIVKTYVTHCQRR